MSESTCATCRHFHQPVVPDPILPATMGECRWCVHVIATDGLSLLRAVPYYPVLPATWRACGQYRQRSIPLATLSSGDSANEVISVGEVS